MSTSISLVRLVFFGKHSQNIYNSFDPNLETRYGFLCGHDGSYNDTQIETQTYNETQK